MGSSMIVKLVYAGMQKEQWYPLGREEIDFKSEGQSQLYQAYSALIAYLPFLFSECPFMLIKFGLLLHEVQTPKLTLLLRWL